MIEIKHLSKTFQMKDGAVNALKDINLTIPDGSIYGIIGMSGAGKSTLVRCINLLERPTEGSVVIDGVEMEKLTPAQLRQRRREITMIFQQFNLLMQRSCLKNICFPMELAGVKKEEAEKKEGNDVLGAPEKGYDETGIELPEGIQLDEGAIEAFKKECKDLNLSQAAYSKLVTNMTSVLAKRAEEQSAQVKQALTAEAKADPQIGGANYAANLKSASRFYAKFFDAETRQFFESVGLNRHAGFIKGCLAAQQALSDDAVVKGGRSGELSTAERARAFFPNSKMN